MVDLHHSIVGTPSLEWAGALLRSRYNAILSEPLPDELNDLIDKLDQLPGDTVTRSPKRRFPKT